MQRFQTIEQPVKTLVDIVCNMCGHSCGGEITPHNFEAAELRVVWGFESDKDGEVHEAHLCEKCWDELVSTFSLPPTVTHPHDDG